MHTEIIEGTWDELVTRQDLHGRRVRVIVLDESTVSPAVQQDDEWLKRFNTWVGSHAPVGHFVDDSRESIYSGTADDPR